MTSPASRRTAPFRALPAAALLSLLLAPGVAPAGEAGEPGEPLRALEARAEEQIRDGEIFSAIKTLDRAIAAAPERLDLRMRVANLQKKRNMWLRAADQYRAVLDIEPGHVPARMGYAELLLADYQFEAAERNFRVLIERGSQLEHKDLDRAQIGLGSALYATGRYREAIEAYAVILERHPDEPTARAYTNFAMRSLGDLDGAARGWKAVLDSRPDLARAKILLAEVEELRAAIVRQREEVARRPDDAQAHLVLGDLLIEKPDLPGAIAAYSRSTELDPANAGTRFKLGVALREAGHLQASADVFRSVVQEEEYGTLAGYNLAWCERRLAGPQSESAAWQKVVHRNPTDDYAYRRYLDSLDRSGHLEREVGLLLGAIKERATDPLPRVQYGVLSVHLGRWKEAALAFLDALSLEPNDPWGQKELRRLLRLDPRLDEELLAEVEAAAAGPGVSGAVSAYRRAAVHLAASRPSRCVEALEPRLAAQPGDARAAVALAGCLRASGESPGRVIALLQAAGKSDPGYLYAKLDLALIFSAAGRFREAATEAQAATRLDNDNVFALTAYGVAMNEAGGKSDLIRSEAALRRALQVAPMDPAGVARIIHAKVAWKLGMEREARRILGGDLPVEPEEVYRVAWEFVRDNYRDRTFNGQDWMQWRGRFEGSLDSEQEALGAIALMLASLDDPDTRLRSAHQTESLMFTQRSSVIDRDPTGRTVASSRSVASETLDENVGYVAVTNMHDPKLTKQVGQALDQMDKREGVILDLRGNLGGSERDAEAIAEMLIEPGTPTGTVVTPEGSEPQVSNGAAPPKIPDKPIVVLVDRNTASSAEALAGALKESKRAVIVGENTYGKAGIQRPRLLPGGAMLLLATAENADLEGISYSGRGIDPDVRIEESAAPGAGEDDPALRRAREIIRKRSLESRTGAGDDPTP